MSPPAYIKYLSLTPHVELWKASSVFMSATKSVCYCTLEQNRPYQCLIQVYFGADTEITAIVDNSSLNRQVQSCVEHPVGIIH